jgi:PPP family 3-phenylpropionic acid transporter
MVASFGVSEERGTAGGFPKIPEPAPARPKIATGHFAPLRELLTNRKLAVLLLASFPLFLAINAAERFFPIYLDSSGASSILIGLIFTLPAVVEIPVFLRVGKLSDRIGARKPLLIFSAAVYALLFFLFVLISNPLVLLLVYPLLAPLAWPPLITGSSTLVSEIVPSESWVTGQTLLTVWMWSICGILGPLLGRFISDAWGLQSMFAVTSLLAAVSALSFMWIREK